MPFESEKARWQAVCDRNPAADGHFVYSVATTGVYCRPSCPSKQALQKNVRFHPDAADAEKEGFRPCRRCRPDLPLLAEELSEIVSQACRLIEQSDRPVSLNELARTFGLSPSHFHRTFKSIVGVTPKAYAQTNKMRRLQSNIDSLPTVSEALVEAGYDSQSQIYGQNDALLGMSPTEFKSGGKNLQIQFVVKECSLGYILVAATSKGVCAVSLADDPAPLVQELQARFHQAALIADDPAFQTLATQVVQAVESSRPNTQIPLDIQGTAFQRMVWNAIRKIPQGKTATYAEIAQAIGRPKAIRAVAQACGQNTVAVLVPCHRVVRTDGRPSGYRWGLKRKEDLLNKEQKTNDKP